MSRQGFGLVAATLGTLVPAHTLAQDGRWIVQGFGTYWSTARGSSSFTEMQPPPFGEQRSAQRVDDGTGGGFSIEYLWRENLGVEAAAFLTSHDVEMTIANDLGTFTATDSTRFRTFTLGVNYRIEWDERLRWSVGGFVPLLFADGTDHRFAGPGRTVSRAYDQDYGLGLKGGLEWTLSAGSPFSLNVEGRYMFLLIMESESTGDIDVDPLVVTAGLSYRF